MAEYIEREAVMKIIDDYGCTHGGTLGSHSGAVDVIGSAIYKLPVVETAELKWTEVMAMEREKLFRGNRTDNGEWVCGDLLQDVESGICAIVS